MKFRSECKKPWHFLHSYVIILKIVRISGKNGEERNMIRKAYLYACTLLIMILCMAAIYVGVHKKQDSHTVSLYSWHSELMDQSLFHSLSQVLTDFEVNRVYQYMSVNRLENPAMEVMIRNLADIGVETVALNGDNAWLHDGLDELEQVLQSIAHYNETVLEEYRIRKIALDVEVHLLEEWDEDQIACFEQYITVMKEAKEMANSYGLQVIQVIPTRYDDVDQELFLRFLQECCDELSIMNYNKSSAYTAIAYEVEACREYGIPVESVFETMPVSEEYGVTKENTFFYDDLEELFKASRKIKEVYGRDVGIGYHQLSTIYEMKERL